MMNVSPSGAISRLSIRIRERRKRAKQDGLPVLTSKDEENISDFEDLIASGITLLELERDALDSHDSGRVSEYTEMKEQLLEKLTLKQPVIEPFLTSPAAEIVALKATIRQFAELLRENGKKLEGMADASRTIVSEIERFRLKQSLVGIYDKNGQLVPGLERKAGKLVRNI